jgi:hypothetical protein
MNRMTGHITAKPVFDSNGILLDKVCAKKITFTSLESFFNENTLLSQHEEKLEREKMRDEER